MTKDEALKLALKTLDSIWYSRSHDLDGIAETVIAIHVALGQPEPQPVAKYSDIVSDGGLDPRNKFDTPPKREPEPVVWAAMAFARLGMVRDKMHPDDVATVQRFLDGDYTPPPKREPLTDEQLEKGRDQTFSVNNPFCPCDSKTFRKVARWVEAAHGIGEKK